MIRGYGKIDPLMALFNAAALLATNPWRSSGRNIIVFRLIYL